MSYQVIARKYRPQRFSEVVGQEHVTQTLSNAIKQNRIAHAYLFVGPRGTGKTTVARIFAKCLNCTGGPKVDFDDADPRCREIAEGRSLDVLEIDGASNRGIEEIRELRETVKYSPANSKFKIYIIDEVHMLTKEAFNALLKTLEEPPAHVKFMFATTEPEKVLATILSRCQRFDLRRIPAKLIVDHLARIAEMEGVKIDANALLAIARGADGGMRDAESTLDQLISFCGSEIIETEVLAMFGLTAQSRILALAQALLSGQVEAALSELEQLDSLGKDLGRLLADLLRHFRNLLICQISPRGQDWLELSETEAAALREQGRLVTTEALTRILEVLSDCEGQLRDASSKRILIEIAFLKVVEARNAVSLDAVLKQLRQLRDDAPSSGAPLAPPLDPPRAAPAPAPSVAIAPVIRETAPEPPPATAPPAFSLTVAEPAAPAKTEADLPNLWAKVVDAVGRASPFVRSYLLEAHPVSFAKNILTIGFDPEFADHLALVDNSRNHAIIQTKLKELGCDNCYVKFIQAEAPEGHIARTSEPPAPAPAPTPPASQPPPSSRPPATAEPPKAPSAAMKEDDFKNDPLIKKALEIFKGQIVEVRG